MPAPVAGIHVLFSRDKVKTWLAGTSPAMTAKTAGALYFVGTTSE